MLGGKLVVTISRSIGFLEAFQLATILLPRPHKLWRLNIRSACSTESRALQEDSYLPIAIRAGFRRPYYVVVAHIRCTKCGKNSLDYLKEQSLLYTRRSSLRPKGRRAYDNKRTQNDHTKLGEKNTRCAWNSSTPPKCSDTTKAW